MTDYTVDDYTYGPATLASIAASFEAVIELYANTKTIHICQIVSAGGGGTMFRGILIIDSSPT